MNSQTVSVLNAENSSHVELSLCRAVKFLLLDKLDKEMGNKRRAKIMEIYSWSVSHKEMRDTVREVTKVNLMPYK